MTDYVADYIYLIENGLQTEYKGETTYLDVRVGKKIKQAIKRHLDDVEKSKNDDYPYYYDPSYADEPINFIELLPDPKTRRLQKLAKFQKFIIGLLYGWRRKRNDMRRFRKAYISLARKNGKSILVAGIALYELLMGRNPRAARQVYSAANTKEQAEIVFRMIKSQLTALRTSSPIVKKTTTVKKKELEVNDESFCKPLSSDADTLDGLDVLLGVLDEYGEAKNSDIIEVLESSQSQQLEALILIISTATKNLNGPMFSTEYQFITKLLNGEVEADAYLALCWEMDDLSEVDDEANWIKANPLFEVESQRTQMTEHKVNSLSEYRGKDDISGWLTKEMNFWVQSSKDSYVTKEEWEVLKAAKEYNIRGRKVYIGLDLSRTDDITAVSWVIPIEEEGKFLIDTHGFVSSKGGIDRKIQNDKIPYRQYENMGLIDISTLETGLVDIKFMVDWLVNFVYEYDLEVIGVYYDPVMINTVLSDLNNTFYEKLIEVPQRINYLSAPTRTLREMIRKGDIIHTGNPLLTRAMYNAVLKETNDAIMIDKSMNRNKIDPVDAVINAMYDGQFHDFNTSSAQELYDSGQYGFGV